MFLHFLFIQFDEKSGLWQSPMTAWPSCIPLFLNHFQLCCLTSRGRGAVAQWSGHSTLSQEVWVQGLAGSLWCVRGKDTYLSQCLSPPRSINGMGTNEFFREAWWNAVGVTLQWRSHPGGSNDTSSFFMLLGNRNKLYLGGPIWLK